MAVDYQKNIVSISVASLRCFAVPRSTNKCKLWEKFTDLMTDSVNKKLEAEAFMEASLISTHNPAHLFCVTNTCEIFASGNLLVLKHVK